MQYQQPASARQAVLPYLWASTSIVVTEFMSSINSMPAFRCFSICPKRTLNYSHPTRIEGESGNKGYITTCTSSNSQVRYPFGHFPYQPSTRKSQNASGQPRSFPVLFT